MFGQSGDFLKDFFSLSFTLLGVGFGRLAPTEKSPLGGAHVAGDLFTQKARRASNCFYRLVNDPDIVGIADVSLKRGGIDPNPPRLNRSALQHLLDQLLVKPGDPILAKALIELDQSRCIGDRIHQRKPTKIPPWQSLSDLPLHFFVAQTPAKLEIHHPKIDADRRAGTTQARIENLFKGFDELRIGQKLIDLLQLFVEFIKRSIDKAVPKTHLLRYGSTHDLFLHHTPVQTQEICDFFSEN